MPKIRKGTHKDIPQVIHIYDEVLKEEEQGKTSTGWIRGIYPTEETAWEALNAGDLFVMASDETIIAAARINQIQMPAYKDIVWKYEASEKQVMVLHTLVVDPSSSGMGYGSRFVKFYEAYAHARGCPYLRIDTNVTNQAARKLYQHLGYREAGIVPCTFNGIPNVQLVCLEKVLKDQTNV